MNAPPLLVCWGPKSGAAPGFYEWGCSVSVCTLIFVLALNIKRIFWVVCALQGRVLNRHFIGPFTCAHGAAHASSPLAYYCSPAIDPPRISALLYMIESR